MGPGILPETTVGKHNPPCHLQMPTKALSCKKKAICEHGPEVPSCPVGQGSFKMDCFKVEKCSMVRRVQIWLSCWKSRTRVLRAKEEGDLPACYQHSVQKPASLMVWRCISAYLCSSWQAELSKSSRTRTTLVTVFSLCCHLVSASVAWWQKLRDSGGVSSHRPSGS